MRIRSLQIINVDGVLKEAYISQMNHPFELMM